MAPRLTYTDPAYKARKGMELDPMSPKFNLPQHIAEVVYPDGEGGRVLITTTGKQQYEFAWGEVLAFPRREDGSTKDWRKEDPTKPFFVLELRVGDLLRSHRARPDESDMMDFMVWQMSSQRVLRVHHAMSPLDEYIVLVWNDEIQAPVRYKFHELDPIVFPHRAHYTPISDLGESGLYRDTEYEDVTYTFLTHPYGRGRWPADTAVFQRQSEPGHYVSRPPGKRAPEWVGIEYADKGNDKRHPWDPKLWAVKRKPRARTQDPVDRYGYGSRED